MIQQTNEILLNFIIKNRLVEITKNSELKREYY